MRALKIKKYEHEGKHSTLAQLGICNCRFLMEENFRKKLEWSDVICLIPITIHSRIVNAILPRFEA